MTNKEAVQATVAYNYPFGDVVYLKVLLDNGLAAEEEYTTANMKQVDLCAAALIQVLLTSPDIQEGGYRVSISERSQLASARKSLLGKYGISDNSSPTISANPTYLW